MTAQPEEKLGIVWMRPGRQPVYFQLPVALAKKKMAASIARYKNQGGLFCDGYASAALEGLLQNKKNNR
jgi:hypothetical protein